jgi:acetyl esterase
MNRSFSAGPGDGENVSSTIEGRIRAHGAVLDMPFTQSIYKPLLDRQPRDGAKVRRDVPYGRDERQQLDIYEPEAPSATLRPLLLLMPGGGFIRGDKSERENFGHFFAREGIVTVVANYRLAPMHQWPAGAQDVIGAYAWVRQNVAQLGVDPTRIFLAGDSAGAAHVAAATLVRRFHPKEGLDIAGTVLISGVYDANLERLARAQFGVTTPDPRNEAYFGSNFERYRQMSTVELIDAPPAPLLITFAELDLLGMQVQAGELFAKLVTQHGYNPQLRVIRGHNHLTQVYAVNTGDESLSAPLLEFLRAQ